MKKKISKIALFTIISATAVPAVFAGPCVRIWHLCMAFLDASGFCKTVFDICLDILY